jgi:Tol biopolymer transport system component
MTPQQSIAHYRVTSKLGEGGMGAVYRAMDTKLNREVAIKVLPDTFANDPDRLARFTREAQVLASLNHPNIAAIYGVEDRALVMELVEGASPSGPMTEEQALPIIHHLIDALEYAHDKGIVHRDLKPANLKLTPDGRLKVLDFGLAKAMSGDSAQPDQANSPTLTLSATMAGVIIGTAAYMSPEQARGQNVDKRADIWSFGAVVYELLTGNQLFEGETLSDTLAAVLTRNPDLNAVPVRFRRLLRMCLARDPRQRLRDISGARLLLEETAPVSPSRADSRWWIAACALLMAAVAVLAAMHLREPASVPETVRFQVFPPEGGAFAYPWLALSTDGRKLVFSAVRGASAPQLWIRELDSLNARPLPGTESGLFPFWSPDSRSIGFWANSSVYRIEASGGPSRLLCKAAALATGGDGSGAWSPDGNIYFAAGYSGIFRVPQTGGEPGLVARPDKSRGESSYFFPVVAPDGKRLLYQNQTGRPDNNSIELISMDGKPLRHIGPSAFSFGYAPPLRSSESGHLIVLRQSTLVAQPVDPRTFEPAGDAFSIADTVPSSITYAPFSVSASGTLAYRYGLLSPRRLTWYDRAGNALSTLGEPGGSRFVALSHDGTKLITSQVDASSGLSNLALIDLVRRVPMRFTSEGDDRDPVWSPDDRQIAFSLRRDGPPQLFVKHVNGSGREELITPADGAERPCDWSSDGRLLMFVRAKEDTYQVWTIRDPASSARGKPELYLSGASPLLYYEFYPGPGAPRWVAYMSAESGNGPEVYVQSFPPGAGKFQISDHGGTQPRWRRDGKELFYLAEDGKLMAVDIKAGASFEAGIPHAVFDARLRAGTSLSNYLYDVAPDGQRFLMNATANDSVANPPSIVVETNWLAGVKR